MGEFQRHPVHVASVKFKQQLQTITKYIYINAEIGSGITAPKGRLNLISPFCLDLQHLDQRILPWGKLAFQPVTL